MVNKKGNSYGMEYKSLSEIFEIYFFLNFKDEKVLNALHNECITFLDIFLPVDQELDFLDYEVKVDKKGDKVQIHANNIITCLWFSGIYPEKNLEKINNDNEYVVGNHKYKYYPKSRKFKITKING